MRLGLPVLDSTQTGAPMGIKVANPSKISSTLLSKWGIEGI